MAFSCLGAPNLSNEAFAACNVANGHYRYREDLLALDSCRLDVPAAAAAVTTSANVDKWRLHLAAHPDRLFVNWLVRGFEQGFSGF